MSLDVARPAAQEQLAILAKEAGIRSLSAVLGEQPVGIASRAMKVGVSEGYDIIVFDTAGRLAIDQELMRGAKRNKKYSYTKRNNISSGCFEWTGCRKYSQ